MLDPIVNPPTTLTGDKANVQVDVTKGVATFTKVTATAPGSYVIKVTITSSSGSYSIEKRAVLHVAVAQFREVIKKSVQLKFAADFELITGKHELFQAAVENHFYRIYQTDQVVFSNFNFKQGMVCHLRLQKTGGW